MCRKQVLLALLVLFVGLAYSWDYVVTTEDHLEFFTNGLKVHSEGFQFRDLSAIAFDEVHNKLLFVDKQSDNASIFSFDLASKKYQTLVRRKAYENIQGLAFDPVKGLLFWTDTNERSIYWFSLRPGSKNNVYGNLLIKMDDEIPRAIAVDSCRGYIYWTNTNTDRSTIERARFDGSEREVIIDTNIYMPTALAIDQTTKQMYWADDREGIHYSIETADLNGKNRITLLRGIHQQPNALTVTKDSIYWVDWGYKSVWQLPKNPTTDAEPKEMSNFNGAVPYGIAAKYEIIEQTKGNPDCEELMSLAPTGNTNPINKLREVSLFCVHGVKVSGQLLCNCTPGYTGERCDVSVCMNYCFHGDCSRNVQGHPKCRCNAGYSGQRCEVYACHGYCLNNGVCTLNEEDEPVCQCVGNHEGSRCETGINISFANSLLEGHQNFPNLLSNWIKIGH